MTDAITLDAAPEATPAAAPQVTPQITPPVTPAATPSPAGAAPTLLTHVTAENVAAAIRNAGCAVSIVPEDDTTRLHSASHGVGFQVLWGNRVGNDQYLDFTLSCPLRVEGGQFPDVLLNEWHRSRRFARIAAHGDFIVLEMDVSVTGGVTDAFLSVAMQVWIQMMGQFFLHLRNYRPQAEDGVTPTEGAPDEA